MPVQKINEFSDIQSLKIHLEQPGAMLEFENGAMLARADLVNLLYMRRPNDMFKRNFMLHGRIFSAKEKQEMFTPELLEALDIKPNHTMLAAYNPNNIMHDDCESMSYDKVVEEISKRQSALDALKKKYETVSDSIISDEDERMVRDLLRKTVAGLVTNSYELLSGDQYNDMFIKRESLKEQIMAFLSPFSNQTTYKKVTIQIPQKLEG